MKAIAKARPAPGVEIVDVDEPQVGPGQVKLRLEAASVCGTDLHIYNWDAWSSSRIKPPRIIGHEFCGTIVEVGEGVENRAVGDFVASESHIVCGHCRQCLAGQAHVCVNTRILGVDVDGGFAPYAVIPVSNARPTSRSIPAKFAAFKDALGNAVHTAYAGPLEGQNLLITGMGPIGLMAVAVAKAAGAAKVVAVEPSLYRINLARQMGADLVISPREEDVVKSILREVPGGVDGVLEMSGHPSSLGLAVECTRPGGRISLLGVYGEAVQSLRLNDVIFKGIDVQGIVGRRLWGTWDQMDALLMSGKLHLDPVVTHVMHYTEFGAAMEMMKAGQAGKVVFTFE